MKISVPSIFFTFMIAVAPMQPIQATHNDTVKTAAIVTVGAAVTGAVGYVLYGWYEDVCLNRAIKRLQCNLQKLQEITAQKESYIVEDETTVVNKYHHRHDAYYNIYQNVEYIHVQLQAMQREIDRDIRSWQQYDKAAEFLKRAYLFSSVNMQELHAVESLVIAFNNNYILLQLAHLLNEEAMTCYANIVNKAVNDTLDEATVRSYAAHSAWPLRTMWQELAHRKQAYQCLINQMKGTAINNGTLLPQTFTMISRYEKAQQTIAGFRGYTDDIRTEKEFKLREEQLHNERIQAQAALASAQAQEAQARAQQAQARVQKDQLAQHKKSELIRLRTELSELKQRIADGDNSYYTHQQKIQLQNRINEIKRDINGSYTFGELLFDIFTDRD